jgi:hypothetical protein
MYERTPRRIGHLGDSAVVTCPIFCGLATQTKGSAYVLCVIRRGEVLARRKLVWAILFPQRQEEWQSSNAGGAVMFALPNLWQAQSSPPSAAGAGPTSFVQAPHVIDDEICTWVLQGL